MRPTISLRKALTDKALLGGVLDGESWQAWRVFSVPWAGFAWQRTGQLSRLGAAGGGGHPAIQ
jgi:hypothetical protein